MKPEVEEIHDEITYYWPDIEVALVFRGLHSTDSGAWRGMLEAHSTRAADRRNGGGHLIWQAVTITQPTDRSKIAERLQKRAPRASDEWETDIERCFYDAYCRKAHVPDPVDLADVQLESLEVEHLYDPILPLGLITLLLADQGSTKSYLMLYLAACTVLGMPTVFGPPRRRGNVIYFDWEVDEQVARRRLGWICKGLGLDGIPRGLHYVNMAERGRLVDTVREMRQQIDKLSAVLAVVDSLTFATGGDLNTPEYAAPTMSAIGSLGAGVTKLVSAHPSKSQRNLGADEVSVIGSALFEFRARAIWHMKRESQRSSSFIVKMTTRKPFDGAPQQPLAYRMRFDNNAHAALFLPAEVADSTEFSKPTVSNADRIRYVLQRHGQLDTREIAVKASLDDMTTRVTLNGMTDVERVSGGGGRGHASVWRVKPQPQGEQLPWWNAGDDDDA